MPTSAPVRVSDVGNVQIGPDLTPVHRRAQGLRDEAAYFFQLVGGPFPQLGVGRDDGLEAGRELAAVARWLHAQAHRIRLVHVDGELSSTWPAVPAYAG